MKRYIEGLIKNINGKKEELQQKKSRQDFLYNLGSIFTGVLGVCLLFGTPWLGASLIGGALSLQLSRITMDRNANATDKSLENQQRHLNDVLTNGIEANQNVTRQRKSKIARLEAKRKEQYSKNKSAQGSHQIGNALVAGSIALAGFFPHPLVSLGTLGCIGLKHLFDKHYNETHQELENTVCEMGNVVNDHNIGAMMMNSGCTGTTNSTGQNTQTMGHTRTATRRPATEVQTPTRRHGTVVQTQTPTRRQVTQQPIPSNPTPVENVTPRRTVQPTITPARRYSAEDEAAVEEYLRSLTSQDETTNGRPRRRV